MKPDLKDGFENNILFLFIGFMMLPAIAMITQYTHAVDSIKPSQAMNLGTPFFVEHYQGTASKPESTNKSISSSFSANGTLNDTISISAKVNASETFRGNDTAHIQGKAKFVTENKDTASYNFYAIGNYNPDGTFNGSGVAVFDDGATGNLPSLSNSVAIYKDLVDKNRTGTFLMWHWR